MVIEYYRAGDTGFFRYPIQEGKYVGVGFENWTTSGQAMDKFLLRYLGTTLPLSSDIEPASAFPWLWIFFPSAVALVAVLIASLFLRKRTHFILRRESTP